MKKHVKEDIVQIGNRSIGIILLKMMHLALAAFTLLALGKHGFVSAEFLRRFQAIRGAGKNTVSEAPDPGQAVQSIILARKFSQHIIATSSLPSSSYVALTMSLPFLSMLDLLFLS